MLTHMTQIFTPSGIIARYGNHASVGCMYLHVCTQTCTHNIIIICR